MAAVQAAGPVRARQQPSTSRRGGIAAVAAIGVAALLLPILILTVRGGDAAVAGQPAPPSDYRTALAAAVADMRAYWQSEFPRVFGGKPFRDVKGPAPYTRANPPQSECTREYIPNNAFYCPLDHGVFYDDEGLIPKFVEEFGQVGAAIVLAHELGHAVSHDAGIDTRSTPTVVGEQQADCFAGAWLKQAITSGKLGYAPAHVDNALSAVLTLRDPLGEDPDHGTSFDRAGAFEEGFDFGAARCATYSTTTLRPIVLRGHGDAASQLSLERATILHSAGLSQVTTALGQEPVTLENVAGRQLPCETRVVADAGVTTCASRGAVGFTGEVGNRVVAFGDWAVAGAFGAHAFAAAAQRAGEDVARVSPRRWDCLVGVYARLAYDRRIEGLELQAGDLDELVAGVLVAPSQPKGTAVSGLGFERVASLRTGFLGGPEQCSRF